MKPGDVVLVRFYFTHLETTKKRPALVMQVTQLTSKVSLVTIAMITSKIDGLEISGDYLINDWKTAGLLHPSCLRLSKMATVDRDLIEQTLGHLSTGDLRRVKVKFMSLYRAWVLSSG